MNENTLVVLLVVIIFTLIGSIATEVFIFYKLVDHFNDMGRWYISIHKNLDRLVEFKYSERWKHLKWYTSTCNRLDEIIGSLDDLCNAHKDTHSVEVEKCKDLKEEKKVDGECADCMFRSKSYHEEPCFHCSHAYLSQFTSSRNK